MVGYGVLDMSIGGVCGYHRPDGASPVSWDLESQGSHGVSSVIKRHRARMLGAMWKKKWRDDEQVVYIAISQPHKSQYRPINVV